MKEKKNSRTYAIRLTEEVDEAIQAVMEHTNIQDVANTIRYCISFTKSKLIPEYISVKKSAPKRTVFDNPMDKVAHELAKKKEKAQAEHALKVKNGMRICELLDGEVVNQEGGHTACKFTTYELANPRLVLTGSRTMPIDDLYEELIQLQYKGGTKEEVLKVFNK